MLRTNAFLPRVHHHAALACVLLIALASVLASAPAAAQSASDWQDVAYEMDIALDTETHAMTGTQTLRFTNDSPDTLTEVFYHLYFNAFHPESMMAERNRELPDADGRVVPRIFELGPDEIGFHRVSSLTQGGVALDFDVTDTVLRASLAEPLAPGETAVLRMEFTSQVPLQTRRSGRDSREGIDYSMAQWYPKLAAYDISGWHNDPYVGREFYAPHGSFDVRITVPQNLVIGATGVLQNKDEIGHGYQTDSTRTYAYDPAQTHTWHFVAEDVHDFAWAADVDYLHDRIEDEIAGQPVTYHILYEPEVAEVWANQREWVPALMQCLSEQFGPYTYPQMTVAQAGDGGMEYPMINFNTGRRSPASLLGVTAHELVHEWFYAMVGFNEADFAWPDEGFTTFASAEAIACMRGREASHIGPMQATLQSWELGFADPMDTPSDWFERNRAYGVASYNGGRALLHSLAGVIGPEARDEFLRALVREYRYDHASPAEMERLAEEVSGVQLDWFFQQYTGTTWELDYEIEELESTRTSEGYVTSVEIDREGRMVMPQTVRFHLEDGTHYDVHVPLGIMQGSRPAGEREMIAEPWLWTFEEYDLEVTLPARPTHATLDPELYLPDRNRLNNTTASPVDASFLQPARPNWRDYSVGWRPLVTYASSPDYSFGIGIRAEGGYWLGQHDAKAMLTVWPERLNDDPPAFDDIRCCDQPRDLEYAESLGARDASWFEGVDYELSYQTSLVPSSPSTSLGISARKHLGVLHNQIFAAHAFGPAPLLGDDRGVLTLSLDLVATPWSRTFSVADDPSYFYGSLNSLHQADDLTATLRYDVGGSRGRASIALDVGGRIGQRLGRPNNVFGIDPLTAGTRLTLTMERWANVGPLRARAGLLAGIASRNLAPYRNYRLGQPSVLETWHNDAARTGLAAAGEYYTFIEERRGEIASPLLHAVSTFGPVGYAVQEEDLLLTFIQSGTRTLAGSLELGSEPLLRQVPLSLFAFSGAAYLPFYTNIRGFPEGYDGTPFFDQEHFFADAGLGARLAVGSIPALQRWAAQSDVLEDLTLVFKAPVYLYQHTLESRNIFNEPAEYKAGDEWAFRYLIGIEVRP
jgi:hypothetical protein